MKIKIFLTMWTFQLSHVKPTDILDPDKVFEQCSLRTTPPGPNSDQFVVGEFEVDVELELVPHDEMVNRAVVALRQKAAGIRADAHVQANAVEEQAKQLLAIEHKP